MMSRKKHPMARGRLDRRMSVWLAVVLEAIRPIVTRRRIRWMCFALIALVSVSLVEVSWLLSSRWDSANRIGLLVGVLGFVISVLPFGIRSIRRLTWLPTDEIKVFPSGLTFANPQFGERKASESHAVVVLNSGTETVHQVWIRMAVSGDVEGVDLQVKANRTMECAVWNRTDVTALWSEEAPLISTLWVFVRRLAPDDRYDFTLACNSTGKVVVRIQVRAASMEPMPQMNIVEGNSQEIVFGRMPPEPFGEATLIFFPCALESGEVVDVFPRPLARAPALGPGKR